MGEWMRLPLATMSCRNEHVFAVPTRIERVSSDGITLLGGQKVVEFYRGTVTTMAGYLAIAEEIGPEAVASANRSLNGLYPGCFGRLPARTFLEHRIHHQCHRRWCRPFYTVCKE